jgi:tRNA (adenine57-N1/adenine58-N1)-methyltransferase
VGYILMKLNVVPGCRIIEAGSGSGALTVALARFVTPGGHVYSYEIREDMHNLARNNVQHVGLEAAVTFHHQSVADGFEERDVDAVFLDLREPWTCLEQAAEAMVNGAFFGAIVPTVNQMVALTTALQRRDTFTDLEVSELLLRQYKTVPERVRPLDRMTAHTGYLLFARKVS